MDKQQIIDYVRGLTNYFGGLADSEDPQVNANSFVWNLGLFMANQLLRLAQANSPDVEELKLLVKVLEEGDLGSGWFDLTLQAQNLLKLYNENLPGGKF